MSNQFNNQKKCRISGCSCTYEIIPGYKDLGVCKYHSKRCQGQFRLTEEISARVAKTRPKLIKHEKPEQKPKENKYSRNYVKSMKRHKIGEACFLHRKRSESIENGKFTSSSPNLVPIEIVEEFAEKEIGFCDSKMIEYFESQMVVKKNNGDSSPIVNNPTYLNQSPQPENNHTGQSAKINANDTNQQSPKIGRELTESREPEKKKAEIAKDNKENGLNKNELLVIDLKNVKKIILRDDGKLEIEFDNTQNDNCSIIQVITDEQIKDNQELQKIKNYCQKNGKNSLNQQELNNILNSSSTYNLTNKPVNNNYMLAIGLSIAVALVENKLPDPVSEEAVKNFFAKMKEEKVKRINENYEKVDFNIGDLVKITEGTFINREGRITYLDKKKQKVKIIIESSG
ncbi:17319_t:CDS:2 [Cetraspora pellucida]|uniref:17319_t:CDS:1 n=1 Tax=Cetraspora pellucida TaxID=1433469 RepID=A0ACA9K5Q0_9GLOM|nr:17319_t:CDS:2 [Cetraspora pellucida]